MRKTNKIFGIYADAFNGKVGQTFAYMQYFSELGYVRMISTVDNLENIVHEIDVLVVPGGADVLSSRYNMAPGVMDSRVNQHYEYLDSVLIPQFIEAKKPIVGICRGMQSLNVFFGGTLNQHIIGHHQGENRVSTKQEIQFEDGTSYFVNTMHHQSVDKLGENMSIVAYGQMYQGCYGNARHIRNWKYWNESTKKHEQYETAIVPEIIKHNNLPIVAFQYHPEEFNCRIAVEYINNLLK